MRGCSDWIEQPSVTSPSQLSCINSSNNVVNVASQVRASMNWTVIPTPAWIGSSPLVEKVIISKPMISVIILMGPDN